MFNITSHSSSFHGRTLTLESGELARQADGAVLVTYGKTQVLCTVCFTKTASETIDFLPLTVIYQEKFYSAGKIPGGYIKRETKPSDREVLTSRLIDRSIRPIFDENFHNEIQVICTVISYEKGASSEFAALVGVMAAIKISGAPVDVTIAGVQIGMDGENFVINPATRDSKMDLFVSGTANSVLMVESEIKELPAETLVDAISFALTHISPLVDIVEKFTSDAVKAQGRKPFAVQKKDLSELKTKISAIATAEITECYNIKAKQERVAKINLVCASVIASVLPENYTDAEKASAKSIFHDLEKDIVRKQALNEKKRIDGRGLAEVRPISIRTNVLKTTHGSALFTRGETQALAVLTLGSESDGQGSDSLDGSSKERFMLHYNFPGFSVGEVARMGAPGRREIGHGNLARKALNFVLPSVAEFSYSMRMVSEILESNGSSSMATVCASSLAMMTSGVPTKAAVAGIAMGLIKEGNQYAVLSDIMGDEDHLGDMDFKVAGTKNGITALQMDIKITGITIDIVRDAINQAKPGLEHILSKMNAVISEPTAELSESAPKTRTVQIKKDKIRSVIGSGGSVIKDICAKSGANVDISDDGLITIMGANAESVAIAYDMIDHIAIDPEAGLIYSGKVVRLLEHGAIVEFGKGKSGMIHISEISNTRVENIESVLAMDELVKVKVLQVEDTGKVRLSIKNIDQETGEEISKK